MSAKLQMRPAGCSILPRRQGLRRLPRLPRPKAGATSHVPDNYARDTKVFVRQTRRGAFRDGQKRALAAQGVDSSSPNGTLVVSSTQ